MVNIYPLFTNIENVTPEELIKYTEHFDNYSDFNYYSMYCWSQAELPTSVSNLDGNLVIKLADYQNGNEVVSFIGKNRVYATAIRLVKEYDKIKLVPEEVVRDLMNSKGLVIKADRDNFDYIYDLEILNSLEGKRFKSRRKDYNKFLNLKLKTEIRQLSLREISTVDIISKITKEWYRQAGTNEKNDNEVRAINRLHQVADKSILCHVLFVNDSPQGYSINEINKDNVTCHFHKSLRSHQYIDNYFTLTMAKHFFSGGQKTMNWEQDLGVAGLRYFKESFKPSKFLKKYSISL